MLGTSPFCIWASANLSRVAKAWKGRGTASWLFVCMSCLSVWSHGSLSLFPSSLLSLFFLFFYSSFFCNSLLIFFSLFLKQVRANTFLEQGYSFGWLELDAQRFSWHLDFCVNVKCAMSGSPLSVFQLQRALMCSADAVLMFSSTLYPSSS